MRLNLVDDRLLVVLAPVGPEWAQPDVAQLVVGDDLLGRDPDECQQEQRDESGAIATGNDAAVRGTRERPPPRQRRTAPALRSRNGW